MTPAPHARPECLRCRSYYVTWDPKRPHGCRVYGFKSVLLPRDEVRLATGEECRAFEARVVHDPHERKS